MSSHTEVPGVNSAVSKLEELAARMKSDDFGFNENDVSNINIVITAIHELEQERRQLHDELETETIKASVNRHKLHFLPAQIKEELMVAVNSARQSNANAQQELQDKLDNINKNIVFLGERHQELEKENSILHPERELIRQQHEEIISQLNQRMAEKASMQIALNETRDKVRQANQNIVDLEDGILQLKEDLIQERTEARQEKKRLKKAVADTVEKTKDQREQNMGKKKELDNHQELLLESEQKLDAIRKSIRRFETSKTRLEEEEGNLNKRLARQLRFIEDLRVKGAKIREDMRKEEADFAALEETLTTKISSVGAEILEEEVKVEDLEMKKLAIDTQVSEKMEKKIADGHRVSELDNMLQAAKQNLTQKAEDVGRMQAENIEMTEQIEELAESHKAVVNQLNKQLEEFRESLNSERRDRMDLQSRKDSVQKDLEDLKTDTQRYMQTVNQQIQAGKSKHVELSNEGVQIQKELRKDEEVIQKLRSELAEQERLYEEMFTSLHEKTTKMEKEIVSMESEQIQKSEEVANKTPTFHDLETKFMQREEEYDKMKKEVVVLKNEKTHLEDSILRVKRQKEAMGPLQAELREDLKQVRREYLEEMKSHGQEVQDIEKQIYIEGSKLKTVMDENSKFEEGCTKMEADILQLQREMEDNEKMTGNLEKELVHCKESLVKSWEDDKVMQEVFANRDEKTIKEFGQLLELTESRESIIANVTGRLAGELDSLSRFLDNVSSRRPKETRSGRRPKLQEKRPVTSSTTKGSTTQRADSNLQRVDSAQEAVKASVASTGTSLPKSQSVERLADLGTSRPETFRSRTSTPGRTSRS